MNTNNDLDYLRAAIEQAKLSVSEDAHARPKVGVVVVSADGTVTMAHRGECSPGDHAEFTALERKLKDAAVAGATVYTTLEPCTTRNHPKVPCAKRLIERRVNHVVIGTVDPNPDISGKGILLLRDHNIEVSLFPNDLMAVLEELNRDFRRAQSRVASPRPERPQLQGPELMPPLLTVTGNQGLLNPQLRVEFGEGDNFRFQTPCEVLDNGYIVRWSCYVRVRVVNVGGKVAR